MDLEAAEHRGQRGKEKRKRGCAGCSVRRPLKLSQVEAVVAVAGCVALGFLFGGVFGQGLHGVTAALNALSAIVNACVQLGALWVVWKLFKLLRDITVKVFELIQKLAGRFRHKDVVADVSDKQLSPPFHVLYRSNLPFSALDRAGGLRWQSVHEELDDAVTMFNACKGKAHGYGVCDDAGVAVRWNAVVSRSFKKQKLCKAAIDRAGLDDQEPLPDGVDCYVIYLSLNPWARHVAGGLRVDSRHDSFDEAQLRYGQATGEARMLAYGVCDEKGERLLVCNAELPRSKKSFANPDFRREAIELFED